MTDLENKTGLIIAIAFMVLGTIYYFSAGLGQMGPTQQTSAVLQSAQVKVAVADGTVLKLFALSSHNALAALPVEEGSPIPEENTLVIGSEEANMMREEQLFAKPGDKLENLFGINTTVGGVLEKTGTVIDDMHFVSGEQFRQIEGEEGRVFVKFTADGLPKVFYRRAQGEAMPIPLIFAEGSDTGYETHEILNATYYPLIIGATEANMMREEQLFAKPGDFIKGFFGQNVVVVGILAPTNTSLDMMHILPLDENELA